MFKKIVKRVEPAAGESSKDEVLQLIDSFADVLKELEDVGKKGDDDEEEDDDEDDDDEKDD